MGSAKNTVLEYAYRDASNYKWFHTVILDGTLRIEDVRDFLIDGEFFVPQEIGLKSLTPTPRTDDDHDLHEIRSLTPTERPADCGSAKSFIVRIQQQYEKSWKHA